MNIEIHTLRKVIKTENSLSGFKLCNIKDNNIVIFKNGDWYIIIEEDKNKAQMFNKETQKVVYKQFGNFENIVEKFVEREYYVPPTIYRMSLDEIWGELEWRW